VGEGEAAQADAWLGEELSRYIDLLRADEWAVSKDIFDLHNSRGMCVSWEG